MSGFLSNKILDKEFKKSVRGYSVSEVDDFLNELAEDFENNTREINGLKERLSTANEKLKRYEDMEKNLQGTLLLAQSTAEASKVQAEKEAELILREAEEKASKRILGADKEKEKLLYENERMKAEFSMFRRRVVSFMEAQTDSFKSLSGDLEKENISSTLNKLNRTTESKKVTEPFDSKFSQISSCPLDMEHTQEFNLKSVFDSGDDEDIKVMG